MQLSIELLQGNGLAWAFVSLTSNLDLGCDWGISL